MDPREYIENSSPAKMFKILSSPCSYFVLELLTMLWRPGRFEKSSKSSYRNGLRLLRQAYHTSMPVVWTNVYTPSELIWSMGGVPFMPEVAAATAASLGWGTDFLKAAEGAWYSADLCGFHRCALGMAVNQVLPRPDAIIATSHLCDGAVKFLEMSGRMFNCPYYLVHIPYNDDHQSRDWLAGELSLLAKELNHLLPSSGRNISLVAGQVNAAREQMVAINELRKNVPAPWQGEESLDRIVISFNMLGTPEAVKYYSSLRKDLSERINKECPAVPLQKKRLLWLHFKPYYPNPLLKKIEQDQGNVIAFEEVSAVTWEKLSPEDWWGSIAAKILANPFWGPGEKRVELVLKLVREYRCDGVIHFSHWGCRQSTGMVSILREALNREGIPFLNLEGDCIDSRNFMEGQSMTRVESFLEMLN
ncbi:MAG: 2-hydroxyglutaryl-CoA dehydratase D-component [Desulfotomaculum sp. 46_296]|nr:MAG: 2-hydroxyglutaryl-CoA dehydratase D-component [Desulfotomaculum sp. 46_296]KUK85429.1 MAG: 2-hydroxyglutaryl-CoA dehydratase D-component [Desulfofundulus kuznetsovii]HBY03351.1 hypothetical protein [Desulfotomaculum sp.]